MTKELYLGVDISCTQIDWLNMICFNNIIVLDTSSREYVNRINLYRQRVWTCKYTGKINLTYEEALLSEVKATEKVQQFPKEFMGPVLRLVQFSKCYLRSCYFGNVYYDLSDL